MSKYFSVCFNALFTLILLDAKLHYHVLHFIYSLMGNGQCLQTLTLKIN